MPVYDTSYSYWSWVEAGDETRYLPYYTYKYYYKLVRNCNNLISVVDPATATIASRHNLGCALVFRALAYLDMARMFEYRRTGIPSIDSKADAEGIWGLTVPLVTEATTMEQAKQNPRLPFYHMYRFILTDLNHAEQYLADYERPDKNLPDLSVVYGMKARFWMEVGTRFELNPDDLSTQLAREVEAADGYDNLGIGSAADCFRLALDYARRAYANYAPITEEQWYDKATGFNTPNQSWMWTMTVKSREQIPGQYYNSFMGVMATEPEWSMCRAYKAYRMIGSSLYAAIPLGDWRRHSWVGPADAGRVESKSRYSTSLSDEQWVATPAYANLKFRPAQGNLTDYYVGLLVSLPQMRAEEMAFIEIEALARLNGYMAGAEALKNFVSVNRMNGAPLNLPELYGYEDFQREMMLQKRIEFWGEGLVFFDYKRLALQVDRSVNVNTPELHRLRSVAGYVAPWMNYYILEYEREFNTAVKPNPDTSGVIKATTD